MGQDGTRAMVTADSPENMDEVTPVDFRKLLAELRQFWSDYRIAKAMKLQIVQVQRIARKGNPDHWRGERLIALHKTVVTKCNLSPDKDIT